MTRRIGEEHIADTDFLADYQSEIIEAESVFQQSLSFLLGWIPTKKKWKQLIIDVDGRLLVSSSPTKSNTGAHSIPAPTTTNSVVLAENADRKQMIIQNTGSVDCYLSFDDGAATSSDFLLIVGATLIDDVFYGDVNCISASGTGELRISELT